jgi:hypothetical protein
MLSACRKDKLPEPTQTGKGTIGCLIDGKVFKPSGGPFSGPIKKCVYEERNGGHYFILFAKDNHDNPQNYLTIETDQLVSCRR